MPLQRAGTGDTVTFRKETSKKSENAYVRAAQPAPPDAPILTTEDEGGSLSNGTYSYILTKTVDSLESGPGAAATIVVDAGGSSNTVFLEFPGEINTTYNIYGRTADAEELIDSAVEGESTFEDDGSETPDGEVPEDTMYATVYLSSSRTELEDIVPGYTGGTYSNVYPNASTL